jgi:hypothetical protein
MTQLSERLSADQRATLGVQIEGLEHRLQTQTRLFRDYDRRFAALEEIQTNSAALVHAVGQVQSDLERERQLARAGRLSAQEDILSRASVDQVYQLADQVQNLRQDVAARVDDVRQMQRNAPTREDFVRAEQLSTDMESTRASLVQTQALVSSLAQRVEAGSEAVRSQFEQLSSLISSGQSVSQTRLQEFVTGVQDEHRRLETVLQSLQRQPNANPAVVAEALTRVSRARRIMNTAVGIAQTASKILLIQAVVHTAGPMAGAAAGAALTMAGSLTRATPGPIPSGPEPAPSVAPEEREAFVQRLAARSASAAAAGIEATDSTVDAAIADSVTNDNASPNWGAMLNRDNIAHAFQAMLGNILMPVATVAATATATAAEVFVTEGNVHKLRT